MRLYDNGTLIIENASGENMGEYECKATNTHGTASEQVKVEVNGE